MYFPDRGPDFTLGAVDGDEYLFAAFIPGFAEGEKVEVGFQVTFLLPATLVQILVKVAVPVKEADGGQGKGQVGGRF